MFGKILVAGLDKYYFFLKYYAGGPLRRVQHLLLILGRLCFVITFVLLILILGRRLLGKMNLSQLLYFCGGGMGCGIFKFLPLFEVCFHQVQSHLVHI
jgi:hypothetical protein